MVNEVENKENSLKSIKVSAYAHRLLSEMQRKGKLASRTNSKPSQADIVDPLIEKAYKKAVAP